MIYNVEVAVVANVQADSPEHARALLEASLTAVGYDVYDSGEPAPVYESDACVEADTLPGPCRTPHASLHD